MCFETYLPINKSVRSLYGKRSVEMVQIVESLRYREFGESNGLGP